MKVLNLALFALFITAIGIAQSPIGAWQTTYSDPNGKPIRMIVILKEKL